MQDESATRSGRLRRDSSRAFLVYYLVANLALVVLVFPTAKFAETYAFVLQMGALIGVPFGLLAAVATIATTKFFAKSQRTPEFLTAAACFSIACVVLATLAFATGMSGVPWAMIYGMGILAFVAVSAVVTHLLRKHQLPIGPIAAFAVVLLIANVCGFLFFDLQ